MPLHRRKIAAPAALGALSSIAIAVCLATSPAHALRVMTYNLHAYPSDLGNRQQPLRTVMGAINADVMIAQELNSEAGRDSFFLNVLGVAEPGQWAESPWFDLFGGPEGGAIFYKPAKVSLSGIGTFATSGPRDVLFCTVTPVGYAAASATFRLYSIHLKAGGPATADSTTRRLECTDIRNTLNNNPAGTNFILGGDSNFYSGLEGGVIRLTESQLDNDGRLKDPLSGLITTAWHANAGNALYHTQCPCKTGCLTGYSGGGMDDRFDIWLTSYSMQDGQGLDYYPDPIDSHAAYPLAYGNDGTKYNNDINAGGSNNIVPIAVANALHDASDHLPVVITIQLPAKAVTFPSLSLGQAILGGAPTADLLVGNGATAPADGLSYTLTAPAGFSASGGSFEAPAGASPNPHTIGMSTASVGNKSGTLTVNSDDPDLPTANVSLTGTVLDHAASSLDASSVVLSSNVDFGDHPTGGFSDQALSAYNFGYDALHARLSVNSANIAGGDGRFSIVGGFSPLLIGGTGHTWNIHFNDTGATLDQVYTATLTLASTDEALPGATAASDLVVTLRAKPITNPVGVPERQLPKVLAFYPPHPNPSAQGIEFAFDLPSEASANLAIYDLSGRRVADLISGSLPAEHYQARWDMRGADGARVPAGLYFARFSTPGMHRVARLVVLP
jgi:endonuclease/exonuclease/phosphatase family metal-dependent hydrolase